MLDPPGEGGNGGAAAAAPLLSDSAAAERVTDAFLSIKPFYSNLLDDFGATDSFAIDGDSLLLELLGSERMSWGGTGGQFLQLRASLEQFIQGVNHANPAGIAYSVIFFDSNQALLPGAAAQAARALVAAWLPGALGVPVLRFASWWDQPWLDWLAAARPAMLLLTDLPQAEASADGNAATTNGTASSGTGSSGASSNGAASSGTTQADRRLCLQAYVVACQSRGVQCAFMSELRFLTEGYLAGFRTGWRSAPSVGRGGPIQAAAREVGEAFAELSDAPLAHQAWPGLAGADGSLPSWLEDVCRAASEAAPGGVRAVLGAACCGAAAMKAPASVPSQLRQLFSLAWCLHEVFVRELTLPERALQLPSEPAPTAVNTAGVSWSDVRSGLDSFLTTFHTTAAALLGSSNSGNSGSASASTASKADSDGDNAARAVADGGTTAAAAVAEVAGSGQLALDASMADWIDGRLLRCIVLALWQGQPIGGLGSEEQCLLTSLCQIVQHAACSAAAAGTTGTTDGSNGRDQATTGASWAEQLPQMVADLAAASSAAALAPASAEEEEATVVPPVAPSQQPIQQLLPIQGNALVEAVVGDSGTAAMALQQGGDAGGTDLQVAQHERYLADYHWHTGKPIEVSQLEVQEEDEKVDLTGMSLEEIATSTKLPGFLTRSAARSLRELGHLLKAGFAREAERKETDAKAWLAKKVRNQDRQRQMYYRHLETYAKSLSVVKFSRPPARTGGSAAAPAPKPQKEKPAKGGGGGGGGKGKAGGAPKKADLLKAKNEERLAAKAGGSADEQWATVRAQLEKALDGGGWTAEVAGQVEGVLSSLVAKSAASYLVAATWRVRQLSKAWEAALRTPRSGGDGTADTATRAAANLPLATELWASVTDMLQRGLLHPGAAVPDDARQAAVTECCRALGLLGLTASMEHVAALLAPTTTAGTAGGATKEGKEGKEGKVSRKHRERDAASSGGSGGVGLADARFQLRLCGHLLPLESPAERDPRVQSFNPDMWQRRVLDAIDDGASALIVAPTSSGKTFISSYCISSVVRALGSTDGVVVFVAPTKALVNQVAAQVYKDFEGDASCGIFTRDYRHNVEGCRILVTVPACLEILLLSPSSQDWVRRIRYAILDEVHCMREVHLGEGGARDGAGSIWEHILCMLRCPFLALSATIGNPGEFRDWLGSVKQLQSEQDTAAGRSPPWGGRRHYEVLLIQHSVRHSDLRLHTYLPRCLEGPPSGAADWADVGNGSDGEDGMEGMDAWQVPLTERVASLEGSLVSSVTGRGVQASEQKEATGCGELQRMNPLATLEMDDLQQGSFPAEMSLEPVDVEQLWDAMHEALQGTQAVSPGGQEWHANATAQLEALTPERYFAALSAAVAAGDGGVPAVNRGPFITRPQVRKYEAALKELLLSWAAVGDGEAAVPEGRATAAAALGVIRAQCYQQPPEHGAMLKDGQAIVGLVLDLLRRRLLPAIAFSFERRVCHRLAEEMVEYLEACEKQDRDVNAAKYRTLELDAERAAKAARAARDKKPAKPAKRGEGGEKQEREVALPEDADGGAAWDADAVLPEFSLAGKPKQLSAAEVEELIQDAAASGGMDATNDPLVRGLRRGIGIHHGGLPKTYRQAVEILFRAGHLRVVVATGTLAFGIHMPCKTTIFAGDHLFLSALQFRQMMGRAGRRGFDPLGHVVFFGVGPRKIRSLMISPVPHLLGHFPLNITMCLRALALNSITASGGAGGAGGARGLVGASRSAKFLKGGEAPAVVVCDTLAGLFQRPFYAEKDAGLMQQVQHLFRFTTEYLARTGTINLQGEPLGLAGMLCHLHWCDPANLALASLLRCGVMDDICKSATESMTDAAFAPIAERLLLVMSHLFGRLPLRAALADPELYRDSPSNVVLEDLPRSVTAAVRRHNSEALRLFLDYVRCYVEGLAEGDLAAQAALPMTGVRLPVGPTPAAGTTAELPTAPPSNPPPGSLRGLLASQRVPYSVCSPFAALSGRGDDFANMDDLVRSVRSGLLLDIATLPTVGMVDRHGQAVPLNRYALDYWKHGQKAALVQANGLREGDAWQALSAFSDILRVVATGLSQLAPEDTFTPVVYCMDRLASEYADKFKVFNKAARGGKGGY